jgi:endonuclease/exonuclease/phosphatase family metal-dependent hydrolase
MPFVIRKFTKRVFITANIIVAIFFLLACCNSFLRPDHWWFFALLGLAFPYLLALIVIFLIFWISFRSKWVILPVVCLLIGITNIRAVLGFHYFNRFQSGKTEGAIRILTWNVTWFDEQARPNKGRITYRNRMLEYIRDQNADILCFQEYVEPNTYKLSYNNLDDITKLGYPYHFIAYDYSGWKGWFQAGVALYSRYPIIDTFHFRFPGPRIFRAAESLIGLDLDINNDTIRLYTTHLQSNLFQKSDYHSLEIIKNADDSMYEASKSVVRKLVQGYKFRGDQVDIVRRKLDESPYPEIICGDFNDIPNSYTYFRMKGDRKDAFTEVGGGIGRTFPNVAPTLRIDYIMADKRFEVLQYKTDFLPYSDHYPVVADIMLPDTQN